MFPSDVPGPTAPASPASPPSVPFSPPPRKFQDRIQLHVLLFLLTFATTTAVDALHYHAFVSEFGRIERPLEWNLLISGLWYSLTILGILGAHEMGHYVYCRRYNVNATLPFFLPLPPWPFFTGTLGAVIRIREPFPTRAALFDIGVAGPIAGFVVLVPALFIGLAMSNVVPVPSGPNVLLLGEPLLFRWAASVMFGTIPEGMTLNIHPMVFAAWFGMLATALNLLPFGQLDGGHITYATLRRYSMPLSLATVATALVMTWFSRSWTFLAVIMLLMLVLLGPRHPRVIREWEPLPAGRYVVAVIALIILVLCFTPFPIEQFVS